MNFYFYRRIMKRRGGRNLFSLHFRVLMNLGIGCWIVAYVVLFVFEDVFVPSTSGNLAKSVVAVWWLISLFSFVSNRTFYIIIIFFFSFFSPCSLNLALAYFFEWRSKESIDIRGFPLSYETRNLCIVALVVGFTCCWRKQRNWRSICVEFQSERTPSNVYLSYHVWFNGGSRDLFRRVYLRAKCHRGVVEEEWN